MPLNTLAEAIAQYGHDAFLLTIAADGPHAGSVTVVLEGERIGCELGRSAGKNIARTPNVSLFWPPPEPGGYALIVNGTAVSRGGTRAEITITKSVLHRPGPKPADSNSPCPSDCRRLSR